MYKKDNNSDQKKIYFKAYEQLTSLERTLEYIKQKEPIEQISIIGQVTQFYHDKKIVTTKTEDFLKSYWQHIFENKTTCGTLYNLEIGHIFVVGNLTSIFLNKVDGKTLGMLSVGPQGILIAMGASERQTSNYLNLLKTGSYLFIFRGYEDEWKDYKSYLERESNV